MSYKLTSLYGTAHGHAVAITLPYIWEYMENNMDKCVDYRGKEYLAQTLSELRDMIGGYQEFQKIYDSLGLENPKPTNDELDILVDSVNPVRLKNNPVELDKDSIKDIYVKSLKH